jgi:hypothetical protein
LEPTLERLLDPDESLNCVEWRLRSQSFTRRSRSVPSVAEVRRTVRQDVGLDQFVQAFFELLVRHVEPEIGEDLVATALFGLVRRQVEFESRLVAGRPTRASGW